MPIIRRIAATVAGLWIYNVWFNRFNKDTGYRGGGAENMKEEFAEYGFSEKQMYVVGAVKVGLASLLIAGNWYPRLIRPAATGLAAFMVGALGMHVKVGDPIKRSLPALSVLTASVIAAVVPEED